MTVWNIGQRIGNGAISVSSVTPETNPEPLRLVVPDGVRRASGFDYRDVYSALSVSGSIAIVKIRDVDPQTSW